MDTYSTQVSGYRGTPLREVKEGNWVPLFQGGFYTETGRFSRDPGISDVLTFVEMIRELTGKDPSGPYYEYLRWFNIALNATRFVIAPPHTRREIISLLTDAWGRMVKDPQFLSDQEKVFGSKEENMFFGEEARRRIQMILDKPAVVRKVYDELISK